MTRARANVRQAELDAISEIEAELRSHYDALDPAQSAALRLLARLTYAIEHRSGVSAIEAASQLTKLQSMLPARSEGGAALGPLNLVNLDDATLDLLERLLDLARVPGSWKTKPDKWWDLQARFRAALMRHPLVEHRLGRRRAILEGLNIKRRAQADRGNRVTYRAGC
jgi:hypothetical protein